MRAAKVAWSLLSRLIVFSIAGLLVCFVLDVAPLRYGSSLLLYTVWFALGVFCGVLSYMAAGGALSAQGALRWLDRPDSAATGRFVVRVALPCLAALGVLFYFVFWRGNLLGGYFVPDSAIPTLTFFVGVAGAMLLGQKVLH